MKAQQHNPQSFVPCATLFTLCFAILCLAVAPACAAMPDAEFIELCWEGSPEAVRKALTEGANPRAKNKAGFTALMVAVMGNEHPGVVRALLAAGAEREARNEAGNTALMYAAGHGSPEVVKALLSAGDKANVRNDLGETALMRAARWNRNPGVIRVLLSAGADVNAANPSGLTPLMCAAGKSNAEALKVLLSAGADTTLKDREGHDALWHARNPDFMDDEEVSAEDSAAIIRLLQDRGTRNRAAKQR